MPAQQHSAPQRTAPAQAQGAATATSPGAARAIAPAQGAPGSAGPRSTGVMGWLRGAGAWMADRADAASKAVTGAVNTGRQLVTDAVELAQATHIGWKDGALSIETDLDELMDLVPAHLRAALQLDRQRADNRCTVHLDPRRGVLVLSSAAIAIGSVDAPALKTGPAYLRDVRIEIARPGGGLGGAAAQTQPQAAAIQVHVGAADVRDVRFASATGPIRLGVLQLESLTGKLGTQGGPLSLTGSDGSASFALKSAVLAGLKAQGHEIAEVKVHGASGGLGQGGEQAHLAADAVQVSGARSGGQSLGSARVRGLRLDAQNKGGGLPLVDAKADHLRAKVAVEAAEVQNFDGEAADLGAAQLSGATGSFDQDAGRTQLAAQQFGMRGLDTAWIDAQSADFQALSIGHNAAQGAGPAALSVSATTLAGDGVSIDPPSGTGGGGPSAPLDWSTRFGDVRLANAQAGAVRLDGARARGLSASGRAAGADSRFAATAEQLGANGVRHRDLGADEMAAIDVAVNGGASGADARAAALSAQGVSGSVFSAASLRGTGASGRFGADGAAGAVQQAQVRDATILGRVKVDAATVQGLQGGPAGNGGRSLQLASADVSGVHDTKSGARLGRGRLRDGSITAHDGGLAAHLGHLQAEQLAAAGASIQSGEIDGLNIQRSQTDLQARAESLSVAGATLPGAAGADRLRATGLTGGMRQDGADVRIDALEAEGLRGGGARVAAAGAQGVRASRAGAELTAGVQRASAQGIESSQLRASTAQIEGLAAASGASGTALRIDAAAGTQINAAGLAVGGVQARGIEGRADAGGVSGAVAGVDATQVAAGGVRAASLQASDLRGHQKGDSRGLAAATASARGIEATHGSSRGSATELDLRALALDQKGDARTLTLAEGRAAGLQGTSAGMHGGADALAVEGLAAQLERGGTTASLARASATGVRGDTPAAAGHADRVAIEGAQFRSGAQGQGLAVDTLALDGGHVAGRAAGPQQTGGTGSVSGLDTRALVASAAQRIDRADLHVHAPLRTGPVAGMPVDVREGTAMDASVQVRDNRLVPGGTGVNLSRPLDGPLWTGVNGAYMTDDNELKADLRGTLGIDMDLGSKVNSSLGLRGEALPSLGTMGEAYGRTAATPSTGGPSALDTIDLKHHQARGTVGLSAGPIRAGAAGGVELDRGQQPGDNVVRLQSDGQSGQRAAMERLLLRGAQAQQGGVSAVAGATKASGVELRTGPKGTEADVEALRMHGLRIEQGRS